MPKFTQQHSQEMFDILVEIYETLTAKSEINDANYPLSQYEISWLMGIDELLKRMNDPSL